MKVAAASALAPGAGPGGGRRRGERRRKEAWRKHVHHDDVERFLEDQRLEERLGKFAEKSDAELFTVDTTGAGGEAEPSKDAPALKVLSAKQRRRALLPCTPKCYEILLPTSKVEDPNRKRNTVRAVGARAGALSRASAARAAARGAPERKAASRRLNAERARGERRRAARSRQEFAIDVWETVTEAKKVAPSLQSEWFSDEVVRLNVPAERRVRPPPRAAALRRPVPPALPPPHPGQSYNPSYQDHQALLREVCEKEQLLMKKEKHLERVTTKMFKHVRSDQAQTEWLKEMMSGLDAALPSLAARGGGGGGAGEEQSGSESEYAAVNPPALNRKKDRAARRRQREQKDEAERLKRKRTDKKKIADIYKLRFLEGALARADERLSRLRALRAQRRDARRAAAPPALNAHKPRPAQQDFLAPDELAPALRAHTHTGNLLRERFESLQRRGALAPSRVFLRKKLRLRTYFKPGHKVTAADVAKYAPPPPPAGGRPERRARRL